MRPCVLSGTTVVVHAATYLQIPGYRYEVGDGYYPSISWSIVDCPRSKIASVALFDRIAVTIEQPGQQHVEEMHRTSREVYSAKEY